MLAVLAGLVLWLLKRPTVSTEQRASPDGRYVAIVTIKTQRGWPIPGPEPPEIEAQEHQFRVLAGGKEILATEWRDLGTSHGVAADLDLAWSPDSQYVAHRLGRYLFVGSVADKSVVMAPPLSPWLYVASFRWTQAQQLVILAHDFQGQAGPFPSGRSNGIEIVILDPVSQSLKRLFKRSADAAFLDRSLFCSNEELCPVADRVAFTDGPKLCIYDWSAAKMLSEVVVDRPVERIWWIDSDRILLGTAMYSDNATFKTFSITDRRFTDVTAQMKPAWDRRPNAARWFETPAN